MIGAQGSTVVLLTKPAAGTDPLEASSLQLGSPQMNAP